MGSFQREAGGSAAFFLVGYRGGFQLRTTVLGSPRSDRDTFLSILYSFASFIIIIYLFFPRKQGSRGPTVLVSVSSFSPPQPDLALG